MQQATGVSLDAIRRADEPTLVDGDDLLDAAMRDVLGPDSAGPDGAAVAAGYRAAVAEVLPSGVGLRGLAFAGSAVTPENAVAAIRAAVSAGGVVAVVAHLTSDALAARLLRSAVRRAEADLTQLRAAQRANAQRRVAEGVPKARIARDLGVQRVTVDAWLRTSATAESAPPTPAPAPTRLPPAVEPADPIGPPNPPIATPRPRRTGRGRASTTARGPALLRFDPDTVRLQRWPEHLGGWLVHALDPDGRTILIGHLTRQDRLDGRTRGWQPLDEQRHRITDSGPLPKTRPEAVAAILRTHEQRHTTATRQRRRDKAARPTGRNDGS